MGTLKRNPRFPDFSFENQNPLWEKKKSMENQGIRIADLTESNPTRAGFLYPREILTHEFNGEFSWVYNPDPQGLRKARSAIAGYYQEREPHFPIGFWNLEDFFLTSGTSESYSYILKTLTQPGDEVLMATPGYPLLEVLADLELVKPIPFHKPEDIERKISSRTKAIFLVQPANPTGKIMTTEEINEFLNLAERFNLSIVIDEVFSDYIMDNRKLPLPKSSQVPIFTLNGISKMAGLPSWKLAWIHVQSPNVDREEIHSRLEWLCDSYLTTNSLSQELLSTILQSRFLIQNQIKNRIRRNLAFIRDVFSDQNSLPEYNQAGWYALLNIEGIQSNRKDSFSDEMLALKILESLNIFLHPGSLYGIGDSREGSSRGESSESKLVISLITDPEVFQDAIPKLYSFLFTTPIPEESD